MKYNFHKKNKPEQKYDFHNPKKKAQDDIADMTQRMLRQELKKIGIDLDEVKHNYTREIAHLETSGDVYELAQQIAHDYGSIIEPGKREDREVTSKQAKEMLAKDSFDKNSPEFKAAVITQLMKLEGMTKEEAEAEYLRQNPK